MLPAERRGVNNEESILNCTEERMPCGYIEFIGLGFSWDSTLAISATSRTPCTQISLRTPFPSRCPVPNLICIKKTGKMFWMGTERLNMPKEMMPSDKLRLLTIDGSGWSNLSSLRLMKTVDLDSLKRPYNHFNIIGEQTRMNRHRVMQLWRGKVVSSWSKYNAFHWTLD